jgi:hypothetical protein
MTTAKVSVAIGEGELEWARSVARIEGNAAGTRCFFRHRAVTKGGVGDGSQAFSLLVE